MPAKFVVKKGPTGKFRFSLVATNGQVVASSESYETKAACMNGVRSVQKSAAGAIVDDRTVVAKPAATAVAKKAPAKKVPAKKAPAKKAAAAKPASRKTRARKT